MFNRLHSRKGWWFDKVCGVDSGAKLFVTGVEFAACVPTHSFPVLPIPPRQIKLHRNTKQKNSNTTNVRPRIRKHRRPRDDPPVIIPERGTKAGANATIKKRLQQT
jgi:hypothetical protein